MTSEPANTQSPNKIFCPGRMLEDTTWAQQGVPNVTPFLFVTKISTERMEWLELLSTDLADVEHGAWLVAESSGDAATSTGERLCNQFWAGIGTRSITSFPRLLALVDDLNDAVTPLLRDIDAAVRVHCDDFCAKYAEVLDKSPEQAALRFVEYHKYEEPQCVKSHVDGFGSGFVQVNLTLSGERCLTIYNGDRTIHKEELLGPGSLWIGNPTAFIHGVRVEQHVPAVSLNFRTGFVGPSELARDVAGMKYFALPEEEAANNYEPALQRRAMINSLVQSSPKLGPCLDELRSKLCG